MQINKVKLVGSIPEAKGNDDYYLRAFDCEVYLNDSDRPAKNIKSIQIMGDAFASREGKPDIYVRLEFYVNELDVELKDAKVYQEEILKEGESQVLGYRLPQ